MPHTIPPNRPTHSHNADSARTLRPAPNQTTMNWTYASRTLGTSSSKAVSSIARLFACGSQEWYREIHGLQLTMCVINVLQMIIVLRAPQYPRRALSIALLHAGRPPAPRRPRALLADSTALPLHQQLTVPLHQADAVRVHGPLWAQCSERAAESMI